nr:hypothetical protein [Gemmatimonadota bacterium]
MEHTHDPHLFPLVREPASRWERSGLTPDQEEWFGRISVGLAGLFVLVWIYVIAVRLSDPIPDDPIASRLPILGPWTQAAITGNPNTPPSLGERITRNPLNPGAALLAPALTGALLERAARDYASRIPAEVRGHSGNVYVQIIYPGDSAALPATTTGTLGFRSGTAVAPQVSGSGIWNVVLRAGNLTQGIPNFSVVRAVPMSVKRNGRIGRYRIGSWPCEVGNCPDNPIYATPEGMIEVTPQNKEFYLSKHIQLKQFITKLQDDVWPKYVVVDPSVLDKIELTVQELERMGHPVQNLFAVSGFRSPWYNANGGTTSGRGALSR